MESINCKCLMCQEIKDESELVALKCNHSFCWICINQYLEQNLQPKIKCPIEICSVFIRDSQIRKVLPDELITKYEKLCIDGIEKSHKCLLPQCSGSIIYTDLDVQYACPSCTLYNCIKCSAAHNFTSCSNFQSMTSEGKQEFCQLEIERASRILNSMKRNESRKNLLALENVDLLSNIQVFTCSLCTMSICKGDGIKLRNCSHEICKSCLTEHIKGTIKIPVMCPTMFCTGTIDDREIQSILPENDLKLYQLKCNDHSKKILKSFYQCQTPNCDSFYDFKEAPRNFTCRTCNLENCIKCHAVHTHQSCNEYQAKRNRDSTFVNIEAKIKAGKLMRCTGCHSLLEKISGCNWIQCQKCSLELCWILKIPRWGPKGRGDISGGCKCGVNGKKCDIKCISSCTPHSSNTSAYRRTPSRLSILPRWLV